MSLKQSVTPSGVRNSKVPDTKPTVTDTSPFANRRLGRSVVHALVKRPSGAHLIVHAL